MATRRMVRTTPRTLGARLILARQIREFTQTEVAYRAGISGGALSRYENDLRHPPSDVLASLTHILGVSANWLLLGEDRDKRVYVHGDAVTQAA